MKGHHDSTRLPTQLTRTIDRYTSRRTSYRYSDTSAENADTHLTRRAIPGVALHIRQEGLHTILAHLKRMFPIHPLHRCDLNRNRNRNRQIGAMCVPISDIFADIICIGWHHPDNTQFRAECEREIKLNGEKLAALARYWMYRLRQKTDVLNIATHSRFTAS